MPVPILTNVYPALGPTAGGTSVRLLGLHFAPNVEVYFGGRRSPDVRWVNSSLVYAVTPLAPVDPVAGGQGTNLDVRLVNLDSASVPIPGEENTLAGSFTFQMPDLRVKSTLAWVVQYLLLDFRRQVIAETVMNQHSDYSNETAPGGEDGVQVSNEERVVRLAKVPALVLLGPRFRDNRVYQLLDVEQRQTADGAWVNRLAPQTADLSFEVMGVANKTQVLLNLMDALLQYFRRNRVLQVPCDPEDPTSDPVEFDIEWELGGFPSVRDHMNNSDIVSFTGQFFVRAVPFDRLAGVDVDPDTDSVIDRGCPLGGEGVTLQAAAQHGNCPDANTEKVV